MPLEVHLIIQHLIATEIGSIISISELSKTKTFELKDSPNIVSELFSRYDV